MSGWSSMMALEDNMAQTFRNNDDDTMIKYRNFKKFDTAYDYSDHYYSGSKPSSQVHAMSGWPSMMALEDNMAQKLFRNNDDDTMIKYRNFEKFDTAYDYSDHYYSGSKPSSQPTRKWSKRIQEELKILQKDLPDMIYVRVYESRMDLLRAVIKGAKGTPYHDGLFCFDIRFPKKFPDKPPGLVLNAKPYFTNDEYIRWDGKDGGESKSIKYNERTLVRSLKTMVYTIYKPPKNFEDLVIEHFRDHAHGILVTCQAYMEGIQVGSTIDEVNEVSGSQKFKKDVEEYMKTLVKAFNKIGSVPHLHLPSDDGGTRKDIETWSGSSMEDVPVNVPGELGGLQRTWVQEHSRRGTPGDNIGSTPAGIIGSTSGGPLQVNVETPRTKTIPFAREQIEGHLPAVRSLLKEHNGRGNVSPIHLSFDDEEDRTRVRAMVTGKEIGDAYLKRPFKEAVKTPLTRRIIEFAGPEFKMPANIKLYDGTTDPEDHLSQFSSAANSREWPTPVWCRMFQQTLDGSARRACFKDPTEITKIVRKANETLVAFKESWIVETSFITGAPEVMKISSFMDAHKCPEVAKQYSDKVPKMVDEMMTILDDFVRSEEAFTNTELPRGEVTEGSRRPAGSVSRKEDRFHRGGYGADKQRNEGRNTFNPRDELLRRQLEMALESGKLNHLIKDVRQRGRGNAKGRDVGKDKVINMIRSWTNDRNRKSVERDESWMKAPIVFPPLSMEDASDDPLIIEAVMEGYLVRRVYVDQGASVEVMFEHCFENLSLAIRSRLRDTQMDLVGFAGGVVKPLGKIELEVVFGDGGLFRMVMINFTVVRAPSPYNVIFGRTGLRSLRAVSSTIHSMLERQSREKSPGKSGLDGTNIGQPSIPGSTSNNRGNLSEQCKNQLRELLKKSMDVFAWESADMPGIPRRIIEHSLNVNPLVEPLHKKRVMAYDRTHVVSKEVEEWVSAGIVCPVRYTTWISNPVLVKKGDGSWRMCIDFKNVNSACPKDYYPLPDIDGKIESVVGFRYKCFLDAYKGYHQVQMAQDDEEKTAFYTDQGTYCYTKMPFGLKNSGATYQRLVDTAFQSQIRRNLEAYMDDMVIKSNNEKVLIKDIAETFDNLRRINMKLNPKKYSFGVEEGKFMGYMVTSKGIRANPKKTKAIADMQSTRTFKEMQSLSGKLAALKRFLSQSAERSLPFFDTLKNITKENKDEYRWTENAERAGNGGRKCRIASRKKGGTVSDTLRKQDFERSREELCSIRKTGSVIVAHVQEATKKLSKYSVELGAYNIAYEPRSAMKGQILVDFLSEALLATHAFDHLTKKVLVEVLAERSTDQKEVGAIVEEEEDNWMTTIIRQLRHPGDPHGIMQNAHRRKVHAPVPRRPKTLMTSIMAPWPFYQWGMDILGPLPQASEKLKFVIVAIDYITKWIEAKPLVMITGKDVKKFVWENIVCRFGLPRIIVTDNETQFVNNPFKGRCESLNIKQMNTAVAHPQASGLVERANKSLMEGIKAMLGRERTGWVSELPNERREASAIREAKYKTKMEQYYNQKVRPTSFKPDEYVFRRNEASRVEDQGKLGPKWEGPYRVTEAYQNGSYKLQTMGGKEVPRTWHAINLRKCYV
ncbi:reverse transcriptase domain-containing protein [Tanacetum coccineum]|uniref:Reverse transcriptase domain-containing protein n=1 Tax=Tanacetum coccineum TaxID=301880 RepID=A0ABQ4ZA36_9ASTR